MMWHAIFSIALIIAGCNPTKLFLGSRPTERIEASVKSTLGLSVNGDISSLDYAIDANDGLVIAMVRLGTIVIGETEITPIGTLSEEGLLLRISKSGKVQWSRRFPLNNTYPLSVVLDALDRVYLAGSIDAPSDFGFGEVGSLGVEQGFIASFDKEGTALWFDLVGERGGPIAVDSVGRPVLVAATDPGAPTQSVDIQQYTDQGDALTLWTRSISSLPSEIGVGETLDAYIIGKLVNGDDLGSGPIAISKDTTFIAAYQNGMYRWHDQWTNELTLPTDHLVVKSQGVEITSTATELVGFGIELITLPSRLNQGFLPNFSSFRVLYRGSDGEVLQVHTSFSTSFEIYGALSGRGDTATISAGAFAGTWNQGAGHTIASRSGSFVTHYRTDGSPLWSTTAERFGENQGFGHLKSHTTGSVVITRLIAEGVLDFEWLRQRGAPGDLKDWRSRCDTVWPSTSIASAVNLERPANGSTAGELEPIISGSCLDLEAGSVVQIYVDDTGCDGAIASGVMRDGAFVATTGASALQWDGSEDRTLDFYATAENARGEVSLPCTPLGLSYELNSGTWSSMTTTDAPLARRAHSTVWTGTEMIVWGGVDTSNNPLQSGARYNPSIDQWQATTLSNAPSARRNHVALWTGTEMLIFSGSPTGDMHLSSGAAYDPLLDSWRTISTAGAPAWTFVVEGVWTGSEMIASGHISGNPDLVIAAYDPALDQWRALTSTDPPAARAEQIAVWSGSEMLVFGGRSEPSGMPLSDGGVYDPDTGQWQAITDPECNTVFPGPFGAWIAERLWIPCANSLSVGLLDLLGYSPQNQAWDGSSFGPQLAVDARTAIAGERLFIWGGVIPLIAGAVVDFSTDRWRELPTQGAPPTRTEHSLVWTGNELLVWGGVDSVSSEVTDTGFQYQPPPDF